MTELLQSAFEEFAKIADLLATDELAREEYLMLKRCVPTIREVVENKDT